MDNHSANSLGQSAALKEPSKWFSTVRVGVEVRGSRLSVLGSPEAASPPQSGLISRQHVLPRPLQAPVAGEQQEAHKAAFFKRGEKLRPEHVRLGAGHARKRKAGGRWCVATATATAVGVAAIASAVRSGGAFHPSSSYSFSGDALHMSTERECTMVG